MSVITMQTMRYINLLDKASRVKTSNCFTYNNTIYFAVPRFQMSKAIGPNAKNIKNLQNKLRKRIKIIQEPEGIQDIRFFIQSIVEPTRFKSLELKDNIVTITAGGKQSKAALLGRNKQRLEELKTIVDGVFQKDLLII